MYKMQNMQNVQTWTPMASRLMNWRVTRLHIMLLFMHILHSLLFTNLICPYCLWTRFYLSNDDEECRKILLRLLMMIKKCEIWNIDWNLSNMHIMQNMQNVQNMQNMEHQLKYVKYANSQNMSNMHNMQNMAAFPHRRRKDKILLIDNMGR